MTLQGIYSKKNPLIYFPLYLNYFFLLAQHVNINPSLLWQILPKHLQHFTPIVPWLTVSPIFFFRLSNTGFTFFLSGSVLFVETFVFPKIVE